jgi:RHS repeat-associated protein
MRALRNLAVCLVFVAGVGAVPLSIPRPGDTLLVGVAVAQTLPASRGHGLAERAKRQEPQDTSAKSRSAASSASLASPPTASESLESSDVPAATSAGTLAGSPLTTLAVDAFQTDLFTGAATGEIPIRVPPGAAGTAPKIALRYNSSTVDELRPREQGQGTGLGWTLDVGGFVLRDTKLTTSPDDDHFTLVFGGVSHDLVLIDASQNIYHTKDETFLRLQYHRQADYWTLTTKDGTVHRFGFNSDSKATALGPDFATPVTFRYLLDEVTTPSGVSVRYAYAKQTATVASTGRSYDQAVYPEVITWSYQSGVVLGPAREVRFRRAPRSDWADTSATTTVSFFERERIDTIEVRVGSSLVTQYVLGFEYSIDRDPTHSWGGGATGDLTLTSLTLYGADAVSSLPPLTFAYHAGRLASLSNGIGGTASFTYEPVQMNSLYRRICPAPASMGSCSSWTFTTSETSAIDHPGSLIRVDGATMWRGEYRYPTAVGPGFVDVVDTWRVGITNPELPVYVTGASPTLRDYLATYDKYRTRVTSRTVSDGLGWASTTSFDYWNIALSSDWTEFRGHAAVRAVDPLGHYTDTWFNQDDALKGRPDQIETRSSAAALLTRTVNAWSATQPYPGVTLVALNRTDVYACDGGATCRQTAQSFEYDAVGNPTRVYHWGDIAVTGDERDERTDWLVDTVHWIHRASRTALYDSALALVREHWFSYDGLAWGALGGRGLRTREESRLAGPLASLGNPIITHSYDAYGNRAATIDSRGCTASVTYESGQAYPVAVTTCLGHTTSLAWDARWGLKTSETDPNGETTTYAYDTFGRLSTITGPLDTASAHGSLSHFYLDGGNPSLQRVLTYRTEQHGTVNVLWSERYFDGLGRVYLARAEGPGGQVIQSETTFDARGLVAARSAPRFSTEAAVWTRYTYDPLGRHVEVLHPDGTRVTTAYAPGLVTVTDERGNAKRRFLDAYGRPTRVEEVNGADTYMTTYQYDATGALLRVTNHLGHVTTMRYDALGRKVALSDPNMGSWSYGYDAAGNLVSQTDAKNQTLTFTYDHLGRMLTKDYPDGGRIQWTYDDPAVAHSRGRLTRVADLATITSFAYDRLGRVIKTQRRLDRTTYTIAQTYDALGRVTSRTLPDGETLTYTYNEAGWLSAIPGYVASLTYNARGQRTGLEYANGLTSTWTYHPENFRAIQRSTGGMAGALQNFAYTYDAAGHVTEIGDTLYTGSRTFAYDALNRLTSASGNFASGAGGLPGLVFDTYRYDAIGNLLEKAGVVQSYADPLHPSAVTSRSDGKSFTYDANGAMVTGAGKILSWDADNRLVAIQGVDSASFAYDHAGGRVRKVTTAGTTRYPFPGYEIDPGGVATTYLKLGDEILAARKSSGERFFYHADHLGGVHVVTDLSGARVQLVEYTPWGEVARAEGTVEPRKRFTSKELEDPDLGLLDYGGRYYSALLGRFVSADPFVPAPGHPQSLNRYAYVLNNPVNLIDPSGFFFKKIGKFFKKAFDFIKEVAESPIKVSEEILGSETGRNILAGVIVVGTAVATWYCGGCGAAVGALVGELVGGYAAYQAGGDILTGVVVGGAVGAVTGYLGEYMIAAVPDGGWAIRVGSWAVEGGGQGIAAGFAGGRGDLQSIVLASAIGSTTAIVLNSLYYGMVEYGATLEPGGPALGKETSTTMPKKGVNNWGFARTEPNACPACEGGWISKAFNQVPGQNATAGFHDALLVRLELAGAGATGRVLINVPTMIPSAALTYGALVPGGPTIEVVDH